MGSPVTLNTVRATCTPAERMKVLTKLNHAESRITNLKELSGPKYANSGPPVDPKFMPQYESLRTSKLTNIHHLETCGALDFLEKDIKVYNADVKKRDLVKTQLAALRKKYPIGAERLRGRQVQIDNLQAELLRLQDKIANSKDDIQNYQEPYIIQLFKNLQTPTVNSNKP